MQYSETIPTCKPENASDPFSILANQKPSSPKPFDFAAYEKWRQEDEELLIKCLADKPGVAGCKLYEQLRRKVL